MRDSRSEVYSYEIDQSFAARIISNTYAVLFGASKRGPVEPKFISNFDDFLAAYGTPDAKVSAMHHSAMVFFEQGAGAWVKRVVPDDATYGGKLVQNFGTAGSRVLQVADHTSVYPADTDLDTAGSADDGDDNLFLIYAIGPGGYSSNLKVEIVSSNIDAPIINAGLSVAAATAPGRVSTLAAAAYDYVVTAFNNYGETVASTAAAITTTAGQIARIVFAGEAGAMGYRVYRKLQADADYDYIGTVASGAVEYEDYGALADATSHPPSVSTLQVQKTFQVLVYDEEIAKNIPQESFECSLEENINNSGVQTELEYQINNGSKLIRVLSNAATLSAIPTMKSISPFKLPQGASGSTISDADVILALQDFRDKEEYPASLILNCGYTQVTVQKEMEAICSHRQDMIALLDTPAHKQEAHDSVNYRSVELNLNSNRAALFTNDHYMKDPYNDLSLFVPGSAVAGGLLAFTDRVTNPAFSPAGFRRGISNKTIKLRHRYSNAEKDNMAFAGVNYFSTERAYGTVLREAYTLQTAYSSLSYIPVRRILDVAEQSTERALKIFLHEPNDEITAAQITAMLRDFYDLMVRERMIKRAEVYTRTSDADIQLGNRKVYSLIEPLLPVVRIQHTTVLTKQGAQFEEVIEQVS